MPAQNATEFSLSKFISPKSLAMRWQCSRSSIDRIARRAGLTRYFFGHGRNGMIRYLRKEVENYEQNRRA